MSVFLAVLYAADTVFKIKYLLWGFFSQMFLFNVDSSEQFGVPEDGVGH